MRPSTSETTMARSAFLMTMRSTAAAETPEPVFDVDSSATLASGALAGIAESCATIGAPPDTL